MSQDRIIGTLVLVLTLSVGYLIGYNTHLPPPAPIGDLAIRLEEARGKAAYWEEEAKVWHQLSDKWHKSSDDWTDMYHKLLVKE